MQNDLQKKTVLSVGLHAKNKMCQRDLKACIIYWKSNILSQSEMICIFLMVFKF